MTKDNLESDANRMSKRHVALVTGSTSGIGATTALELARNGFNVAVNGTREVESAKPIIYRIKATGAKAFYIRADISSSKDRRRILAILKREFGRIDILVNNVGIAPHVRTDILKASEESFNRVMAVNLKGPYFLTQLIAVWMIELQQKIQNFEPKIINVSSISAYTSSPSRGEYCLSKAGISMMTKLYADRLSEYNINVYEIRPGIILTPMTQLVKQKYNKLISEGITPIKRWGTTQDIAKAVVAIAKGYFKFSTGEVFNIDGGFHLKRL